MGPARQLLLEKAAGHKLQLLAAAAPCGDPHQLQHIATLVLPDTVLPKP